MKQTKQEANYRVASAPHRNCHLCVHIQLHGDKLATCALVNGTVDRDHVCDLFRAK